MTISRRSLLTVVSTGITLGITAPAFAADDPKAQRFVGKPDAKVTVAEYFSLTCTHCAAFAQGTYPEVKKNLIATGQVKWVFVDYPLDQTALQASQVARYLPIDRYEPFIAALFQTQVRWAFNRDNDPTNELWKVAALAGMTQQTFNKAIGDNALRDWILQQRTAATNKWKIDSTPSFVINGQKYAGEMAYDAFRKLIPA